MQSESQFSQGDLSLPSGPNFHSSNPPDPSHSRRRSWQSQHLPSIRSGRSHHGPPQEARGPLTRERTRASTSASTKTAKWWRIRFFRGMVNDVKRRVPYYWSDWIDAWDYRIVPATVYMYFAKYVLAFCLRSIFPHCFRFIFLYLVLFLSKWGNRTIHNSRRWYCTDSLTYSVVSCPRWLSRWTCLRKQIKASESTRSFWLLFSGQWYSPSLLLSHW